MDVKAVWDRACSLMRGEMSDLTYSTWIATALRPVAFTGEQFVVEAVTDFYHQFVVPRYSVLISTAVRQIIGRDVRLSIMTPSQAQEYRDGVKPASSVAPQLNPKYSFENFVVGGGNRFAHAASLAVAESPADAYNPLFIYGEVGLGKTHLMHAIGHYTLRQKPSTRLEYVTSETFTIELVAAIQTNRNALFREKYRSVDVLLIDDIQFIAGRDSTQEEFFHTFNALHNAGKQIIISSDRPPKEIAKLEERLRSRFEWGLIADIQKPDLDTRCAILRRKADDELVSVGDDVLEMIAQKVDSNIRELEGSLTRLVAYSSLTSKPISMQLAEEALKEVLSKQTMRNITPEDVVHAVSSYYAVPVAELCGSRRTREVTVPRQIAMYLSRKLTDASFPKIGEILGGRDHTTIMHGYDRIDMIRRSAPQVSAALDDITRQLKKEV